MRKSLNFCMLMLLTSIVMAEDHKHSIHEPIGNLNLPKDVHELLTHEMKEIRKGMESMVFAVAAGQWDEVAKAAKGIKQGFILKQRLTEQQRHQLHERLPHGFKEIDRKFHYYAGMLSHVAHERDMELVHFFIYKMNEACTTCHTRYAATKFKGLQSKNKHAEHMH